MRILLGGLASAFYGLLGGLVLGLVVSAVVVRRTRDAFAEIGQTINITLASMLVCAVAAGIVGVRSARRQVRPDPQAADSDDAPPPPPGG